ncbi:hypothetical protein Purlil1_8070 [Purpureocillium lilacinum]|uniref:Proteasome component PUP2 n=1 Tax=Purpureocillium lilacinum TaxID=33203 RepID=A0ABR0BU21_PURLI|nr:hypothetical protein Purlil1_8070 [Purpureocillium lilacinum]
MYRVFRKEAVVRWEARQVKWNRDKARRCPQNRQPAARGVRPPQQLPAYQDAQPPTGLAVRPRTASQPAVNWSGSSNLTSPKLAHAPSAFPPTLDVAARPPPRDSVNRPSPAPTTPAYPAPLGQHRQDVYGKIRIWQALSLSHSLFPVPCRDRSRMKLDALAGNAPDLNIGLTCRLFQVEYSLEAIKLGSTAIGVATSDGVVLGVEKRVTSTLLETSSVEKIVEIDRHIGCAMSGLQADARSMVEHARVECQSHAFNYNEPLGVESCTQAICDLALRFGEGAEGEETIMSRPFGVALLIAGFDEDGPQLFHAEPSGTFYRYDAKAIGSGSEGAQAELQNEYHKSLSITDAETLVLKTLKQVMEEKLDSKNVQLASVTKEKGFRIYTDEEMAAVVERLPAN